MKKKGKIPASGWLVMFEHEQLEAGSIIDRICPTRGPSLNDNFAAFKKALEAFAHSSQDEQDVFLDAVERLPGILENIKALAKTDVIPEPMKGLCKSDVRILRATQKYEAKALNAFYEACKLGIVWSMEYQILALLNSGETDYEVIASKVRCPRALIEAVVKHNKRGIVYPVGEPAIFFRFTQAYKGWELSDKGHSILFDPRWRA